MGVPPPPPLGSYYVLMGKVLDSVTHHPYRGVELSRSLDWSQHVNNKIMEANRSLGFLRQNLSSCPEGVKETAYKALVRPHVEYASSVWDPHLKKTLQTNSGSTKRSRTLRQKLLYTGTRNSYRQPFERVKLDTAEGAKNDLAVVPQSYSW